MDFSGERLVPGQVEADLWAEHFSRYVFAEPLVKGRRLLDLGTGTGYGAQHLARSASYTFAVDISAEAVRYASRNYPAPALTYAVGDASGLPFASGSFDAVVAFELIEHVREQAEALAEVRRVLTPGGIFIVSTPNRSYYTDERQEHNPFHVHEFTVDEFLDFLRPAFPHVVIYLQNHAPAVVIAPAGAEPSVAHVARHGAESREEAVRAAHYAIAVCSTKPLPAEEVVFFPEGTGNVLRTREQHLKSVLAEVASARKAHEELHKDWESRGAWAQSLQAELERSKLAFEATRKDYEELHKDWKSRGAWGQSLEAELEKSRGDFARIQEELENARRKLDEMASQSPGGPAQPRGLVGQALTRGLSAAAGAAAVPLAAGLGAAALALEGVARLLPRRRELPNLKPFEANLATILILNYEGKDLLAKNIPFCQAAIERNGRPHQLLVVDNGSTDGSVEFVREKFAGVDVVALPRNYFFSAGNDRGFEHAIHDIVILLNNDMRVEPDFLDPLLRPFGSDRSVFAVSSQILMAKERQEETGLTRGHLARGRIEFRHDPVPRDLSATPVPILWGGGGACAFDKRKFLEIGGLDVLYDPFYCEDSDLSFRAWMNGWKVLFAPDSKVWHDHRTTSRRVFGEDFVNETVRRNTLLLHWANFRDPGLFAEHLLALPGIARAQVREHGWSGVRSLARAVARAPRALARRLRTRGEGPPLRLVLERTELGVDPVPRRTARLRGSGDPLRITMVTPYHLFPVQHGGAVRMYNVVRGLARRGHDVSVIGFVDSEEQREAGRHLREFCGEVELMVRTPGFQPGGGMLPLEVREFDQPAFRRALAQHVERRDPDILQVEYTHMAPYGSFSEGRVACLTEHDVAFVSHYRRAFAEHGSLGRAQAYARYLEMFHFEMEALRKFDVVFAVTPRDAQLLRTYLDGDVHVSDRAPTGVDTDEMGRVVRAPGRPSVLFVGNFAHGPNVDAVRFFAGEILPEIRRRAPELRVVIAGPNPPPEVQHLASDPHVEVPGFVPDLASLYATTSAFVSPIRIAAGVRVKMLEAFAARVPVVSTSAGAEGIDVVHERDLLVADAPAEFAKETVRLVEDRVLGERLAANARSLVEDRYSWRSIVEALEEEYRAALRRKQGGRKVTA